MNLIHGRLEINEKILSLKLQSREDELTLNYGRGAIKVEFVIYKKVAKNACLIGKKVCSVLR